jgi:hypothetical protein
LEKSEPLEESAQLAAQTSAEQRLRAAPVHAEALKPELRALPEALQE